MKLPLLLAEDAAIILDHVVEEQSYNYLSEFVNMLMTLSVVIGLVLFSLWIMKRLMKSKWRLNSQVAHIKVIERRPLSPKSALYLVDILGKAVVIADTPAGVTLVKEFSDEVTIDTLIEAKQQQQEPSPSFKERLAQKFKAGTTERA